MSEYNAPIKVVNGKVDFTEVNVDKMFVQGHIGIQEMHQLREAVDLWELAIKRMRKKETGC